jgi:hypothetical protein
MLRAPPIETVKSAAGVGGVEVVAIGGGGNISCAERKDHSVLCWGTRHRNEFDGDLGGIVAAATPTPITLALDGLRSLHPMFLDRQGAPLWLLRWCARRSVRQRDRVRRSSFYAEVRAKRCTRLRSALGKLLVARVRSEARGRVQHARATQAVRTQAAPAVCDRVGARPCLRYAGAGPDLVLESAR